MRGGRLSKAFFFAKKKQKTFVSAVATQMDKSFGAGLDSVQEGKFFFFL